MARNNWSFIYRAFGSIRQQARESVAVQETSDAITKLAKPLREIFKKSLKKDRWEGIDFTEPEYYTNDAIVERWKAETGKWLAVRI